MYILVKYFEIFIVYNAFFNVVFSALKYTIKPFLPWNLTLYECLFSLLTLSLHQNLMSETLLYENIFIFLIRSCAKSVAIQHN